jgi:hypothetical protein
MNRSSLYGLSLILLISPIAIFASGSADAAIKLKQGAHCDEHAAATDTGATHTCYFDPAHSGKRDFSSGNGRAEYIFTELGPDCEEIEILADEDYSAPDGRAVALKRVRVVCTE